MEFLVTITWHDDERVWIAQSSNDKYAMTTDHNSFDALLERVKVILEDIAQVELGYKGAIKLMFNVEQRIVNMNTTVIA
ncbi:MAG: DUF1902 domain-containing protein [Oscillospiraceae bacterium]|nr:DUF1902 domain-containing protein [Oscillospiraceae bacterium]